MNKQYAYGPWKPVKDFVQTDRNIQLKTDGHQTTNPSGYPVDAFELDELDEISTLYREVHELDSSWTLNISGDRPNVPDAALENFEVYFANGTVSRKTSLVLWQWEPALNYTILAWRRIGEKPQEKQEKQEFQFVCNENTIVTGILSKEGAKALLKLHEDCQKQCNLLGIPYDADHSLIKQGAEYSYTLGDYLEFQKLGVELFVDNRVKVEA
jgi:hypothetical protein